MDRACLRRYVSETLGGRAKLIRVTPSTDLDAVIVGAGFSGLYMLHRLRDDLGPVGSRLRDGRRRRRDVVLEPVPRRALRFRELHLLYSFSEELEQEWVWSSKYPEQPEILRYLEHVADRFDLRRTSSSAPG